jgi:prepilin-type N-terminal cleavage/methylation domain-containing protein
MLRRTLKKQLNRDTVSRNGVTLVEILIVSAIIAMLAGVSFPIYKIVQQREKERRLLKILRDVRAAIGGCKSQKSDKTFKEGFRNYVYSQGKAQIEDLNTKPVAKAALKEFVKDGTTNGLFYPPSPSHICASHLYTVTIATGTAAGEVVNVKIERRFLRQIPPHPFQSWYPNAHWEFKPATNIAAGGPTYASATGDPWDTGDAYGVTNIVSRGAGPGLDGSNTDDW